MQRMWLVVVLCLLLATGLLAKDAGKKGSNKGGDAQSTLMDLENRWAAASAKGDGETVGAMLDDNWKGLDSDGSMRTKQDAVDRTKKAKWEVNQLSDMNVTMHGDTAVVTGAWTGKGTDADGKPVDTHERWVDTWMKTPGGWKCVASGSATTKM